MDYALFKQGAGVYVPIMLIELAITLVISGVFPLLFAMFRKKSITTKKYAVVCYVVNTLILIALSMIDKESFGGVYIGTGIGAVFGNKILKKKGLLTKLQKPDDGQVPVDYTIPVTEPKPEPMEETGHKSVRIELAVGIGVTLLVAVVLIMVVIGMANQNREVTYGYCDGDAYINSYTGYGCKLNKAWTVYTAEDLLQDGEVKDTGCVMKANCEGNRSAIELYYEKMSLSDRITMLYMSNEGVVDQNLTSTMVDELKETMTEQGFHDITVSKEIVTFLGEECAALKMVAKLGNTSLYLLQVYDCKLGKYGTMLQCMSIVTDTTQNMLDLFYAVD